MSVYVDPLRDWNWQIHGAPTLSCHLWADTPDELLEFAEQLGLPWSWAHTSGTGIRHFNLTPSMRARAIQAGAWELGYKETVASWRALRKQRRSAAA